MISHIRNAVDAMHTEDKVVVELRHTALTPPKRNNPVSPAITVDGRPIRGRRVLDLLIAQWKPEADASTLD